MVLTDYSSSSNAAKNTTGNDRGYTGIILVQRGSSIEEVLKPGVVMIESEKIGEQSIVYVSNPSKERIFSVREPLYFEFL